MVLQWMLSPSRIIIALIFIIFLTVMHYSYIAFSDRLWLENFYIFNSSGLAGFQNPLAAQGIKAISNNSQDLKTSDEELPCPQVPPYLIGHFTPVKEPQTLAEVEKMFPDLSPGGQWRPRECTAFYKVAIIIPYRDREVHLYILMRNLHPMLQRQQLDYGMFVIEQEQGQPFNRGALMNIGFVEALRLRSFDCFIFHDVDLIPEDDRNLYTCPEPHQPRHMSVAIDKFKYQRLFGGMTFGGVSAMTRIQFERVNGFSNKYWGWGAEDDDLFTRVVHSGFKIARYPLDIARYTALSHPKAAPNPERIRLLRQGLKRMNEDGLTSMQYSRRSFRLRKLFTHVLVELPAPDW